MGRKLLLDQATHDLIVDFVRKGNFVTTAAQCCGIAGITVRRWLAKGKKGHPTYARFYQDVTKARAQAEVEDLEQLRTYAVQGKPGPWQALAWILERRNPRHFATNYRTKFQAKEKPYGDDRPLADIATELEDKLTKLAAATPTTPPPTPAKAPKNGHKPKPLRPGHASSRPPQTT